MYILEQSITGFPAFIVHLLAAFIMLALFLTIYIRITPYQEIRLIREGNIAVAISLSGAIIGFTVPLAKAVAQSGSLLDMLMWGGIALIVQLLAYIVVRLLMPGIVKDIPEGKIAQGTCLGVLSLSTGMLNAACMTY
jgi:putative membrane protein